MHFIETVKPNTYSHSINSSKTKVGDNDFNSNLVNDLMIQEYESVKNDYIIMINDVHNLIDNCEGLSNDQNLNTAIVNAIL